MAQDLEAGNLVHLRILTHEGKTEIEGVVLPPAIEGHITIKLANGYNVSHPLDAVEILSSQKPDSSNPAQEIEPVHTQDLPTVRIIHTGGTIASKVDYTTGAVTAQFEPSELLEHVPELLKIANLEVHEIGNMFSGIFDLFIGILLLRPPKKRSKRDA